jgi:hypothetical protein
MIAVRKLGLGEGQQVGAGVDGGYQWDLYFKFRLKV